MASAGDRSNLLSVDVLLDDGLVILRLRGELDLSNVDVLAARLAAARDLGRRVLIDLSVLDFIDSSGLQFLMGAYEKSRLNGVHLSIRPGSRDVMRTFEIAGLDETLPFERDRVEMA